MLVGRVAPDALVVRETVAEDVKASKRTLDRSKLAIGCVRETAGEVRPQPGELLGDEEAPESEAQLADRLPVACALALLPHAVAGARDVQTCSAAQRYISIAEAKSPPQ